MSSQSIQKLLLEYKLKDSGKYISQEFQDFAYRLAMDLSGPEDRKTISMCMRLVKTKPRVLLEQAQSYIKDANARNKIALFLWKLKTLEKEHKAKPIK
jgi:ABC-type thiamine transport system ATPase subunit